MKYKKIKNYILFQFQLFFLVIFLLESPIYMCFYLNILVLLIEKKGRKCSDYFNSIEEHIYIEVEKKKIEQEERESVKEIKNT